MIQRSRPQALELERVGSHHSCPLHLLCGLENIHNPSESLSPSEKQERRVMIAMWKFKEMGIKALRTGPGSWCGLSRLFLLPVALAWVGSLQKAAGPQATACCQQNEIRVNQRNSLTWFAALQWSDPSDTQRRRCQEDELLGTWWSPKAGTLCPFPGGMTSGKRYFSSSMVIMLPALWVTAWYHLFIK